VTIPTQDGLVKSYRDDGSLLTETTFEAGRRHGLYRDYWSNGQLACEGRYVDDVKEGQWRFYNQDGTIMEVIRFNQGREVIG
jgi:uncharacterized protein